MYDIEFTNIWEENILLINIDVGSAALSGTWGLFCCVIEDFMRGWHRPSAAKHPEHCQKIVNVKTYHCVAW